MWRYKTKAIYNRKMDGAWMQIKNNVSYSTVIQYTKRLILNVSLCLRLSPFTWTVTKWNYFVHSAARLSHRLLLQCLCCWLTSICARGFVCPGDSLPGTEPIKRGALLQTEESQVQNKVLRPRKGGVGYSITNTQGFTRLLWSRPYPNIYSRGVSYFFPLQFCPPSVLESSL